MMINKKLLTIAVTAVFIGGCVSDDDLASVQSQVSTLQGKVASLEGQLTRSKEELAMTKGELAVVKEQRVVRLPTGAPTETRARSSDASDNQSNSTNDSEQGSFNAAVQKYKSGDVSGAISAFDSFNASYPNSQYRNQSLFYLGQAAYTSHDYARAQEALEPIVFQPTDGKANEPAARLLKMVYQAQGNTADETRLNEYLQSLTQPLAQTVPVQTAPEKSQTPPTTTRTSDVAPTAADSTIIESNQ